MFGVSMGLLCFFPSWLKLELLDIHFSTYRGTLIRNQFHRMGHRAVWGNFQILSVCGCA